MAVSVNTASKAGSIAFEHGDQRLASTLLAECLGTTSGDFVNGLMHGVMNATRTGKELTAAELNFSLAAISGIAPRDEAEAMLAGQMVAIHTAIMTSARRLAHCETIQQLDVNERTLNKLARTYTTQLDALKRYRSKGEQRVYVERVNVEAGAQAVVGNVTGGRGNPENKEPTPRVSRTCWQAHDARQRQRGRRPGAKAQQSPGGTCAVSIVLVAVLQKDNVMEPTSRGCSPWRPLQSVADTPNC